MTVKDIERLRGYAKKGTHLERYEAAYNTGAKLVLDRWCPYCGAKTREQCHDKG